MIEIDDLQSDKGKTLHHINQHSISIFSLSLILISICHNMLRDKRSRQHSG